MSGLNIKTFSVALVACCLFGCQSPPTPVTSTPVPTVSPVAVATPSSTPAVSEEATVVGEFEAVTAAYEAIPPELDPGYQVVKPLLEEGFPKVLGDELFSLSLESAEQQAAFDKEVLPKLKLGFTRPHFFAPEKLKAGEVTVNFRGLRAVVGLLVERAEQKWSQGKHNEAIDLASLPLSLGKAMGSRPETVSMNLFSSSYSVSGVALLAEWAVEAKNEPALREKIAKALNSNAPVFEHVRQTIVVDFAQLWNSLLDEEGRKGLGIGTVQESTLNRWKKQVASIYLVAKGLYDFEPGTVDTLNERLRTADAPIQGVVIDYPQVVSMQLHSFAQYKATQLGYALLGMDRESLLKAGSEGLIEKVFSDDQGSAEALKSLLEVKLSGKQLKVTAQPGRFDLLAPGEPPIFFQVDLSQ